MPRSLVLLLTDLCLIAISTFAAFEIRENFDFPVDRMISALPHFWLSLVLSVPVLMAFGVSRSIWRLSVLSDYVRIAGAAVLIVMLATILGFLINRLEGVARSFPVLQAMMMVFAMVGTRVVARQWFLMRNRASVAAASPVGMASPDTVLVVGINQIAELYLLSVAEFAAHRTAIAGLIGRSDRHSGRLVQQQKVLGTPEDLPNVLRDLEIHGVFVNRIVITVTFESLSADAKAALLEVENSSEIRLDFFAERLFFTDHNPSLKGGDTPRPVRGLLPPSKGVAPPNNGAALSFSKLEIQRLKRPVYFFAKRTFDIVISLLLIIMTLPLMALVAFAVAVDVGVPTVFWQQRPGRFGIPFKVFKFRTMRAAHDTSGNRVPDAERSAAIGASLRRYRLDELPQLWHIMCGTMSFVGPRPLLPIDQSPAHNARLLVRPGLTGWAQVNGGREVSADDKAALDIWYVRNASMLLDLKVLARTVPMIIRGERIDHASIDLARSELEVLGLSGSR
jgi:lipopolysaccharide/colanic/teichoic acid biosynthesis glycosyltransferase